MNFLQELLDLASDTSPGISASSLSQSLSSLLPVSSCSWSSSGCIAGLLNDSVNIPMVSYHSTYLCIFAELASLLANSITHSCKMSCGFTAGRKRGDRHFAVCSDQWPADFKEWNNWSVTSLIYVVVCGLKLVAKLVLYALTQLNPMVDEIWTMLLGNWCYIINRDDWNLCILELCRDCLYFKHVRWFFMPNQWIRASVPYFGGCRDSCFVGRNKPGVVQTEFLPSRVWTGQAGR